MADNTLAGARMRCVGTVVRTEWPAHTGCRAVAALDICSTWAEAFGVSTGRTGQRGLLALAANAVAFGRSLRAAEDRGVAGTETAAVRACAVCRLALAHTPATPASDDREIRLHQAGDHRILLRVCRCGLRDGCTSQAYGDGRLLLIRGTRDSLNEVSQWSEARTHGHAAAGDTAVTLMLREARGATAHRSMAVDSSFTSIILTGSSPCGGTSNPEGPRATGTPSPAFRRLRWGVHSTYAV